MDTQITIIIVIALYGILMLAIALMHSKSSSGMASFTVGGRNAGAWISALSYGTSYFSAVMFIGYSGGSGWNFGLWSVLVGLGNAIFGSLLAWLVLANKTREITKKHKIKSMPQLFEHKFNSSAMRLFSCLVIFIFLTPYSASVYKGLTSVCTVILGIDETVCMVIIAIASALLIVLGGYTAMLKADFVQGFVMIIGVVVLVALVVMSPQVGGLANGVGNMIEYMNENQMAPLSNQSFISLISLVLMTSFGTWGLPQMVHKYYGIKDKKEVKRGVVISTVFAFVIAGGGYFIGSLSHLFFGSALPEGGTDYLVPNMLQMAGLPDILVGVILVLLISASVSTLSGISLTACSTLVMDFVKKTFAPNMESKKTANLTRLFCLLFVGLSFIIAVSDTSIIALMSYSWGIISGSFLAPYVLTLHWKGINKAGAWAGMITGFMVAFVPAAASGFTTSNGPLFACIAMASSFASSIVVSMIANAVSVKAGKKVYAKNEN